MKWNVDAVRRDSVRDGSKLQEKREAVVHEILEHVRGRIEFGQ